MKLLIFIFLMIASPAYPLAYDSAIYKAQKGNWQDAHSALNSIITDNPDRADVMYDAGVAAYTLGNKCQAATCFTRAAECSADKNIAFCAHFNAGNTYVDEKKLEQALTEYDKALVIEPDNEYARHNRDRVAQMLKEQEQQQKDDKQKQEQNKDQEKNDQNKDDEQQDKQDGNEQQNQDGQQDRQDQNQNQNGNDKQSENGNEKQDQKNDSSQDESLNQQSQGDSKQRDAADNGKDTQRQKHRDNKKEQHQNSANDKKRDGKNNLDKQSQNAQKEGNEQQSGNKHGTTPGQQNIGDDKDNLSAQAGQEQAITDPWLMRILNDQEMHDKAVNKQLMEAKIRQQGGKNGQNCW